MRKIVTKKEKKMKRKTKKDLRKITGRKIELNPKVVKNLTTYQTNKSK